MKSKTKKISVSLLTLCTAFMPALSWASAAPTEVCETISGSPNAEEHVVVNITNDLYQVSHFGSSRSTYSANYKVSFTKPGRAGAYLELTKVSDQSTWKDMPLTLKIMEVDNLQSPQKLGLGGLVEKTIVWFKKSDCHLQTSENALAPLTPENSQCHVHPQNDCSHSPKRLCCDCSSGQLSCY